MLHIEGFEQFANEVSGLNSALMRAGYAAAGTWAVVAGRGRNSRGVASAGGTIKRVFPWVGDKFSTGFAHSFSARGGVCSLKIGAAVVPLTLSPETGMPTLGTTAGGSLPVKNAFYFYEIEVQRGGHVTLYINGRFDSAFEAGSVADVTEVEVTLGATSPDQPGARTYDDFYARNAERLGPIIISTRFPDFDVLTEWQMAGDAGNHAKTVALRPPEPLDNYIASDTVGKRDVFTSVDPLANDLGVLALGVVVLSRKSPSIAAKLGVQIGGSVAGFDETLVVEEAWRAQYLTKDGINETSTNVIASQFGVSIKP